MRKWLEKRISPTPISRIKKIDTEALRRSLKRMKGKKVHGVDNKDIAIVVDQDIIEETKSEKLLGVVVINKLTWKEEPGEALLSG